MFAQTAGYSSTSKRLARLESRGSMTDHLRHYSTGAPCMVVSRPLTTCRLPANNELAGSFTFHSFCGLWWRGRRWTAIAYAFFTSTRPQLVAVSSKEKTTIEHAIDPLPYSLGCLRTRKISSIVACTPAANDRILRICRNSIFSPHAGSSRRRGVWISSNQSMETHQST